MVSTWHFQYWCLNLNAQNDAIHIHSLTVGITATGGISGSSVTAAYLYQGSTVVSSASVVNGQATFTNISDGTAGATTPANSTQPYTVKVDVSGVTSGSILVTASTTAYGTSGTSNILYNSQDGTITQINGTAIGNTQTVIGAGPSFSLVSKSIYDDNANNGATAGTSTITATFDVGVTSVGTTTTFGTQANANPMFTFQVFNGAGQDITSSLVGISSGNNVPSSAGFVQNGTTFYLPISQAQLFLLLHTVSLEDQLVVLS